ncbi:MAG: MSMEG_4193 family putative phosphomutase [Actinomycetota bacterium]|nr:MSMEG_4193 family putative phosphomutase [Actinomycetota bacterium]
MPILLLVRHALTDATGKRLSGWTPDVHLSERGREQAQELVERLAPVRISALYSSPLERCRETAEPLATARRLEVRETEDIGEVRYGDWTGRTLAQLSRTKLWRSVQSTPSAVRFPGGETLLEVQQRAVRQAATIAAAHPKSVVALVSHGDVIRLLLAHYAGMHVDLFQRLVVSPASVSVVAAGEGVPRILRMNDTGGLRDLAPPRKPPPRREGGIRKVGG